MNITKHQAKIMRWKRILTNLDYLGYLTTSQILKLHDLKSVRNTQRILKDMSPYLCKFRMPEHVYCLSKYGREWIGSKRERKYTLQIEHFLLRNQYMIQQKIRLEDWFPEQPKIKIEGNTLIPDAFYRLNNQWYFLEIDRTQKMIINEEKIKLYRAYKESGKFPGKYGTFPTLVFVTSTEYRMKKLASLLNGMKSQILLESDLI